MSEQQEIFLRTIRKALGQDPDMPRNPEEFAELFMPQANKSAIRDQIKNRGRKEFDVLMQRFIANAALLNIKIRIAASLEQAGDIITEIATTSVPEFQIHKHVMLHDHQDLNRMQLWKKLEGEPISIHTAFSPDPAIREKTMASFIGITAPDLAIADCAAIVQATRTGQPRSTSLLPSIHIALIRRENLVADMNEAYAILTKKQLGDSMVFISGPSKTADIEAHLVHGAHGPREMYAVFLAEPDDTEQNETAIEDSVST
jgi:L-lactate dehydrogenase complex protein LldG